MISTDFLQNHILTELPKLFRCFGNKLILLLQPFFVPHTRYTSQIRCFFFLTSIELKVFSQISEWRGCTTKLSDSFVLAQYFTQLLVFCCLLFTLFLSISMIWESGRDRQVCGYHGDHQQPLAADLTFSLIFILFNLLYSLYIKIQAYLFQLKL